MGILALSVDERVKDDLSQWGQHGVTFEQAAAAFMDPLALTIFDEAHSQNEERWWLLGHDASGILLLVAHTYQTTGSASVRIRLISARPATKRERDFYENDHDRCYYECNDYSAR